MVSEQWTNMEITPESIGLNEIYNENLIYMVFQKHFARWLIVSQMHILMLMKSS